MRNKPKILLTVLVGALALAATLGCGDSKDPSAAAPSSGNATTTVTSTTVSETPTAPASAATNAEIAADKAAVDKKEAAAAAAEDAPPKDGEKVAVIERNLGEVVFKFLPSKAPKTVENFQKLANKKFYDGTKFHRVIPGFMIQGGDPNTKPGGEANGAPGMGGPGYSIKAEFNDTHHGRGIVSMARSQDPDSAGSQFFICVADANSLDGQYTAFGKVLKGMDVVDKIVNLPTGEKQQDMPNPGHEAVVKSIRIVSWPVK